MQRVSADGPELKMMFTRTSEASAGFAVAEPAATPEDRQSERSEVCRDRAKEKYKMPEDCACRRAAVVRRDPEAGPGAPAGRTGAGSQAAGGAEQSAAKPGPDGRWRPQGGRGRTERQAVHQAGRERRRGATPATATLAAYQADQ